MDPTGRYTTQQQIKIIEAYFAVNSVPLNSSNAGKILAVTMYLMEGQFNALWPNFGRQELWQMATKDDIVYHSA